MRQVDVILEQGLKRVQIPATKSLYIKFPNKIYYTLEEGEIPFNSFNFPSFILYIEEENSYFDLLKTKIIKLPYTINYVDLIVFPSISNYDCEPAPPTGFSNPSIYNFANVLSLYINHLVDASEKEIIFISDNKNMSLPGNGITNLLFALFGTIFNRFFIFVKSDTAIESLYFELYQALDFPIYLSISDFKFFVSRENKYVYYIELNFPIQPNYMTIKNTSGSEISFDLRSVGFVSCG